MLNTIDPFVLVALVLVAALLVAAIHRRSARSLHDAAAAQLRIIQQGLTEAIQVFGPDGTLISRNPAADRIFEMEGEAMTRDEVGQKWSFIGEDRAVLERHQRPIGIAMRTGAAVEGFTVGLRKRADGSVKWLTMSTFPVRGPKAQIFGYVSCAWDVTEKTQMDRELEVVSRATARLSSSLVPDEVARTLTDAAAELCSAPGEPRRRAQLFTVQGGTLAISAEADPESPVEGGTTALPLADHPYVQRVIETRQPLVAELRYEEFGPVVAEALSRQQLRNCAWVPLIREGAVYAVLTVAGRQHARIDDGQLQRLTTLATMGELALNNAQTHARVAAMARTDPLTGVSNRRALDERLGQLGRGCFALVAIDVDNLKRVNDTFGHHAGDELIARVAATLAAQLRPSDVLARIGGDEFIALLPGCDTVGAVEFGNRLQAAVAALRLPWGRASISVGSAAGDAATSPQKVAEAADVALYAAKQSRRKRRRAPVAEPAR